MIILKKKALTEAEISNFYKPYLIITSNAADEYTIAMANAGSGPSITVKVTDLEPWHRKVYYWSYYGDGFINPPNYEDTRDAEAFFKSRFGVIEVSFVVARGGNNELIVVTLNPTFTALPFSEQLENGPVIEAIASVLPAFKTSSVSTANKAKRDLMAQISILDKISELEKQVDLLTEIVELLVEHTQITTPNWYPRFKAIIDAHSSSKQRGETLALDKIESGKANMRALQQEYFAIKYGNNQ